MALDFNRVPPRVEVPAAPRVSIPFWALLFLLITAAAAGLTIKFWPAGSTTNSFRFWFYAFIRIADGNVTVGGPGDLILKTITLQKQGASSLAEASKTLPKPGGLYDEQFTLRDEHTGEVLTHTAYQMQAPGGPVEGISDALGQTVRVFSDKAQALKIFKGEGHD